MIAPNNNEDLKTSGKLYKDFVSKKFVPPKAQFYYTNLFNLTSFDFSNSYKIKVKQIPDKKICEFNFKVLSNILSCRKKLYKWHVTQNANCMLCNSEETVEHLLFTCPIKQKIWKFVCTMLNIRCQFKTLVLGASNFIVDWAVSLISFCFYKFWRWSNDVVSDAVTNAACVRNLKLNLKNYIAIYKICNYDDITKMLELIYGALVTV